MLSVGIEEAATPAACARSRCGCAGGDFGFHRPLRRVRLPDIKASAAHSPARSVCSNVTVSTPPVQGLTVYHEFTVFISASCRPRRRYVTFKIFRVRRVSSDSVILVLLISTVSMLDRY